MVPEPAAAGLRKLGLLEAEIQALWSHPQPERVTEVVLQQLQWLPYRDNIRNTGAFLKRAIRGALDGSVMFTNPPYRMQEKLAAAEQVTKRKLQNASAQASRLTITQRTTPKLNLSEATLKEWRKLLGAVDPLTAGLLQNFEPELVGQTLRLCPVGGTAVDAIRKRMRHVTDVGAQFGLLIEWAKKNPRTSEALSAD